MSDVAILWQALVPFRMRMLALTVLSVVSAVAQTTVIVLMVQSAVAITKGNSDVVVSVPPLGAQALPVSEALTLAGVVLATLGLLTYVVSREGAAVASSILTTGRDGYLRRFFDASLTDQQRTGAGSFQEVLTTFTQKQAQLGVVGVSLVVTALNLAILVGVAVTLSPVAGLGIVVGAALLSLASRPLATRRRRQAQRQALSSVTFATAASEAYRSAREIRAFDVREPVERRLRALNGDVADAYRSLVFLTRFAPSAFQFGGFALLIGALAVLGRSPGEVGDLGASLVLILRAFTYAQGLQSALQSLSEAAPYAARIASQRTAWTAPSRPVEAGPFPPFESLSLSGVSFAHHPGRLVLDGLDLRVCRGQVLGLAGPSGSGKSTTAMLLTRLWRPQDGQIRVNDTPVQDIDEAQFHRNVALVPQDGVLVEGTVRDNVSFFREAVTEADIDAALRAAGLDQDVERLPEGKDTRLSPDGSGLSGGQRQRLCLARALAGRPEVIVLDEPTSALDDVSATHVIEALKGLRGVLTLVIISHQSQVLAICDDVVLFDAVRRTGDVDDRTPSR